MLLFLVTFLCIQPSTITMYLLLGRLLPIRRKKLLLCIVMVWGNAIWIINNYLMPSPLAALDIFFHSYGLSDHNRLCSTPKAAYRFYLPGYF